MSIPKQLIFVVAGSAALILSTTGCSDMGDEQKTTPPPALVAAPPTVTVGPGQAANVSISGGTPPYVIAEQPNVTLATATIPIPGAEPAILVITGVTVASPAGSTSVKVRDSSPAPQKEVSVPITKVP